MRTHLAISVNDAPPRPEDAPLVAATNVALEPLNFDLHVTHVIAHTCNSQGPIGRGWRGVGVGGGLGGEKEICGEV